jgi:hypothetical protein
VLSKTAAKAVFSCTKDQRRNDGRDSRLCYIVSRKNERSARIQRRQPMNPKKSLMRQKRTYGTVGIGHADREEVTVRNRIPVMLVLLALTIAVAACKGVEAAAAPLPATTSAGAGAPRYAPKEYHDSAWRVTDEALSDPTYAPKQYHDSAWCVTK